MANLTFEDINIGMRFKSLIPIERGDGIEFPEGSHFRVTEVVFNGALEDEQRFLVTLQCTDGRSGYMRQLEVTLALLNQQFEKLEDDAGQK